jgi:hypothetical protein
MIHGGTFEKIDFHYPIFRIPMPVLTRIFGISFSDMNFENMGPENLDYDIDDDSNYWRRVGSD